MLTFLVGMAVPVYAQPVASSPAQTSEILAPAHSSNPYTPHIPPRAIAYQRAGYALGLSSIPWRVLGLWLLLATGLSASLRNGVYRILRQRPSEDSPQNRPPPFRVLILFFCVYQLLVSLWSLPFGLASLALEHRYGFSNQNVIGFLADVLRNDLLNLIWIPLLWVGWWLMARAPRNWWKWLWAASVPLLLVQFFLQPLVVEPLFNRFTPLPSGPLRTHLEQLARTAGISSERIYVNDTSRRTRHVNAYVNGIGGSARIVIEDTALKSLPEDQLIAMLGHEMGHYVEGHLWIMATSASLGLGVMLWLVDKLLPILRARFGRRWQLNGIADVAAIPLLMLLLFVLIQAQMPFANLESRWLEHRADAFGLRVTHLNKATARLMVGFAERDYSDPDPPALIQFWYGTHPTLRERIAFALDYRP